MTTPTEEPIFNELDQARSELREGIEHSREMIRQSRLLIELSGSDGAPGSDDRDVPIAD